MIQETGMLDVGTHCHYCKQLDFLPFTCTFCKFNFCELHRTQEQHHCIKLNLNETKDDPIQVKSNGDKFFQSLLPEKGYLRVKQQPHAFDNNGSKLGTNNSSANRRTIKSQLNQSSLDKLLNFFQRHRTNNSNKTKKSSFFSSSSKTNTTTNKTAALLKLKKIAQGDNKIPESNRIYVYVHKIDDSDDDSDEKAIEPKSFFINKLWPIGRALDFLAQKLDISNKNINVNTTEEEKLFIYKCSLESTILDELKVNDRVNLNINNLDTLYLIRGKIKK